MLSCVWTVVRQAPLSVGFPSQEYWSGLPFPFPGDILNPRFEPGSPALQAGSLPSEPPGKPKIPQVVWQKKQGRSSCAEQYHNWSHAPDN